MERVAWGSVPDNILNQFRPHDNPSDLATDMLTTANAIRQAIRIQPVTLWSTVQLSPGRALNIAIQEYIEARFLQSLSESSCEEESSDEY